MQLSDRGLDFIISFEGKHRRRADGKYEAYRCQAGVPTIYVGCTVGVTMDMVVDEAQGRGMLRAELAKHEVATAKAIRRQVTQDQYDCLVSFSYNCGIGSMQKVAAVLNKGGPREAAAKLLEYTRFTDPKTGEKKVSRGLVRRRAAEAKLMEPNDTEIGPMPQKVDAPPKKLGVKESIVKVGAPVVAAGEAIRQVSVPPAVKDAVANVKELQSVSGEVAAIGKSAWSAALAYPILVGLVICLGAAYWWLNRKSAT